MNDKIIAIGDTHGRSYWKGIVADQTFDKLIFIGDYFDSYEIDSEQQMANFSDIIQYKKENPGKVVLLTGNHDFHYMPVAVSVGEAYSGFQRRASYQIGFHLQEHKSLMQMAYKYDDFLFTHAGVTNTWLTSTMNLKEDEIALAGTSIDEYINDVWKFTPQHFLFNGINPYGDDVTQSPIWVRPASLYEDAYPLTHIVGHTKQKRIEIEPAMLLNGGKAFFIDVLDSRKEYLVIDDHKAMIGKL